MFEVNRQLAEVNNGGDYTIRHREFTSRARMMGVISAAMEMFHAQSMAEGGFERIVSILQAAGVIAYPTDTAYGLGADPFNAVAVRRIFEIKGRSEDKPILL